MSSYYISSLNDNQNKSNENDPKNEIAVADPNAIENQKSEAIATNLDENNNDPTIDMQSKQNLNEILTEVQDLTDGSQLEKITSGNKITTQQSVEDKIIRSASSSSKLR